MNNNDNYDSHYEIKCSIYDESSIEIFECDQNALIDEISFCQQSSKKFLTIANIIKLNLSSQIDYCKNCRKIHEIDETKNIKTLANRAKKFQFDFKSLANNNFKMDIDINEHDLNRILFEIDSFDILNLNNELESIQNRILNKIGEIKQQLKDEKQRLITNLEQKRDMCLNNLNEKSSNLNEYNSFVFMSDKKLNNLKNFGNLIDKIKEKHHEFNSFLLMDQNIRYIPKRNEKIDKNSIGILFATESFNQTDSLRKYLNISEVSKNEYPHLNMLILNRKSNEKIPIINELDFKNQIQNYSCQLLTIHSINSNNLILCNRYAKSTIRNDIYCELNLYDNDGRVNKKIEIKNKLVRCIYSNKKYVLLTLEKDDGDEKNFELNLYDSTLNLIKSATIENDSPLACFIDDLNRCYLVKYKLPFISVYDSELNVINKFGQDVSPNYAYFINKPKSINNIFVKNDILYVQSNYSIAQVDLKNGSCLKTIHLKHLFTNFYVNSENQLIYICENNKLVVFDLIESKIVQELILETSKKVYFHHQSNEMTNLNDIITSFSINNDGFLSTIFYKNSTIATF
jgi:hypothetical protein